MTRRLNDEERRLWVLNDETLYNRHQASRGGIKKYIQDHREEIDAYINAALDKKPAR